MTQQSFSRLSVMIVDDNRNMRVLVRDLLAMMGVRNVVEAGHGAEACELLKGFHPDIVLTDGAMDPVDGFELTRRIRAGEVGNNPAIPIIMISENTQVAFITRARDAGVTEFLAKPVSGQALRSRLAAAVVKPRGFVRVDGFVGPDRRRRDVPPTKGERRGRRDLPSSKLPRGS